MDNQWIIDDLNQAFAAFFTRQFQEGETVEVYYDPKEPSNFFVDTKQSEKMSKILFAAVGIVLGSVGLYQIMSHWQ